MCTWPELSGVLLLQKKYLKWSLMFNYCIGCYHCGCSKNFQSGMTMNLVVSLPRLLDRFS